MYNLNSYKFGELFRKTRKAKNISIAELANKLNKTTTTIYKYERNEILPDIYTVLEICNILNINFDDLTNKQKTEENVETSCNPFPVNELYMYYLGFGNLAEFKLKIETENGFQKVYFVNPINDTIFFVGSIEANQDIAFITMKNFYAVNKRFEKVMIMINMSYASDNKHMGVIVGTKEDKYVPVMKKCIILNSKIPDSEKEDIKKRLCLTEDEKHEILEQHFWYVDYSNRTDFN